MCFQDSPLRPLFYQVLDDRSVGRVAAGHEKYLMFYPCRDVRRPGLVEARWWGSRAHPHDDKMRAAARSAIQARVRACAAGSGVARGLASRGAAAGAPNAAALRKLGAVCERRDDALAGRGLHTLVHFSAQLAPCLTHTKHLTHP